MKNLVTMVPFVALLSLAGCQSDSSISVKPAQPAVKGTLNDQIQHNSAMPAAAKDALMGKPNPNPGK